MSTESSDNRSRRSNGDRQAEPDALVQKSHEITSTIKQAALDRVDGAKASAYALRENTSHRVRKLGAAVHKVGEHFRIEDQQYISEQMIGAGKQIGRLADYVDAAEIGTLVRDARQLARRNSTAFWGGAFLLGLGTARFFKGTSLMAGSGNMPSRRSLANGPPNDEDEVVAPNGGEKRRQRAAQSESKRDSSRADRGY